MRVKALVFHPDATAEVEAATRWYAERSPQAGRAFVTEIEKALDLVAKAPQRWPIYSEDCRRFPLWRFPFWIVYREQPERIEIVAVSHARRRPGYWRAR